MDIDRTKEAAYLRFTKDALKTPGFFELSQKEQLEIIRGYTQQDKVVPLDTKKRGTAQS